MLEWYEYFPTSYTTVSMADVRKSLPSDIQLELIGAPKRFESSVAIESSKTSSVDELDRLLRVHSSTDFQKQLFVEITISELSNFPYYQVVPMRIEPRDINCELSAAQCDRCYIGASLRDPIKLSDKVYRTCDFGRVMRPHDFDITLVLSERIKATFESEGITGLEYRAINSPSTMYLATINSLAWQHGDSITLGANYCDRHSVVVTPVVSHLTTAIDDFHTDFIMIRGVKVSGTNYTYVPPRWAVSRKLLQILLSQVRGLQRATVRINEQFKPFLAD
jgi:hypothetical protein